MKFGIMLDIDFFIEQKTGQQKKILEFLHQFLISYPEVVPKIRYKIPFYFRKSWICYLNPIKKDGIELAFTRANELSNEQGLLNFKNRKQVGGIEFFNLRDIQESLLNELFQEALLLDDQIPYTLKKKST